MGTLTSVRTCTPTPSCPVAPPCTPVSPTECRRRSPPWLPPPSRSRSSLPLRGSTPCGSVAPSSPPSPPSSRCGSPSRSTTSAAPPLSTASASKLPDQAFILPNKPSISHTYQCACVLYVAYFQIMQFLLKSANLLKLISI